MLRYRQNNEIRRRTTTTAIVIINILMEETDKVINKILVKIKRFIKGYIVLSLFIQLFPVNKTSFQMIPFLN